MAVLGGPGPGKEAEKKPVRNVAQVANAIAKWIGERADEAQVTGLIVAISGGLDSAVAAGLGARARPGRTYGAILPCNTTQSEADRAEAVIRRFGLRRIHHPLEAPFESFCAGLPEASCMARANLKARLRMAAVYFYGNHHNLLVVGTGNKSEDDIGYMTKYGDGGVDICPMSKLYKSEVSQIASHLGVPQEVIEATPTAGLWPGQTDEEELGITYAKIELILRKLDGEDVDERVAEAGITQDDIERIAARKRMHRHKVCYPPIFEARTVIEE